jgi:hypothetical protein
MNFATHILIADLKKLVERLALKERTINKDFDNLATDYRQFQQQHNDLTRRFDELTQVQNNHQS